MPILFYVSTPLFNGVIVENIQGILFHSKVVLYPSLIIFFLNLYNQRTLGNMVVIFKNTIIFSYCAII